MKGWTKAAIEALGNNTPTPKLISRKQKSSALEERFANLWRFYHGPILQREFRFHPSRKWRFDFALPEKKIAIEIEGACWTQGRHTRGSGFVNDAEKYLEATLMGWTVYRLPEPLITADFVLRISLSTGKKITENGE